MSSDISGASGLAGRYAMALYDLADQEQALDDVANDVESLRALIDESHDLRRMLGSPVLTRDEQATGLDALLEKIDAHKLTRNFVGLVARNRRLFALADMLKFFRTVLAARRGETTAEVVSAHPLSDAQIEQVKEQLKRALGTDVSVETRTDAALLGGLVVKVGSRMFDSSLRSKLQRLNLAMKGVA